MDLTSFNAKLQSKSKMNYQSQYNSFWHYKVQVEKIPNSHILDDEHRATTCKKLLGILPGWQTWRGADCNYQRNFPVALSNIANSYSQIRQYSLLEFNKVPAQPLQEIWHELGRVKETSGTRTPGGDYFVIAICKPLMFLWGQTLAFDSKNRKNIRRDNTLSLTTPVPTTRWCFSDWQTMMSNFQNQLNSSPAIVSLIQNNASVALSSPPTVPEPYGRYLDIYYF